MSSGMIISLVAVGAQDVFLTGNPQITFFKNTYRRYTNFSMETMKQPLFSPRFGNETYVIVQRSADMISHVSMELQIPELNSDMLTDKSGKIAWVRRLGHAICTEYKIKIGGTIIDTNTNIWMDIFWDLTHPKGKEENYLKLIGDVSELTELRGITSESGNSSEVLHPQTKIIVPLQFWFCRNYGLSLPLIALQYHETNITFTFERVERLIVYTGSTAPSYGNIVLQNANLLTDYVTLESGERTKVATTGHEYLIEQVQKENNTVSINNGSKSTDKKIKINFNHPIKELFWAMKVGAFSEKNNSPNEHTFLAYSHTDSWTEALDNAAKNLVEHTICIDTFNPSTGTFENGNANISLNINGISLHRCSNIVNPGFNNGQRVTVEIRNLAINSPVSDEEFDTINETGISVYAYNTWFNEPVSVYSIGNDDLFDFVNTAHVVVTHSDGANIRIECTKVDHSLNLVDMSIPKVNFTDNRLSQFDQLCVNRDVVVIQYFNYGLTLDGRGNPIQESELLLNNTTRTEKYDYNYYNYYQPYFFHTASPPDGINVFSFALTPETHQPSGTTNFSRIDNAELSLKISDTIRTGPSSLKFNISNNSELYVFGWNYNIFRVMSGMGGLAYSN